MPGSFEACVSIDHARTINGPRVRATFMYLNLFEKHLAGQGRMKNAHTLRFAAAVEEAVPASVGWDWVVVADTDIDTISIEILTGNPTSTEIALAEATLRKALGFPPEPHV
jgi:hypothetical protein